MNCQIDSVGTQSFKVDGKDFVVEIIDQVDDYLEMMKNIFDFNMIKQYLKSNKVLLNSLHGGMLSFSIYYQFSISNITDHKNLITDFKVDSQFQLPVPTSPEYSVLN